ncbi:MAG: lysine--tRNA ligase [Anaerolineae bacterium]|nr:lysine--tRNA ligase [Anaerolineae bacterium]
MADSDHRSQRIAKLEELREQGIDPYPARASYTHTVAEALDAFEKREDGEGPHVQIVGRMVSQRIMGRSSFAHLADGSGKIQIYVRQDIVGEETYHLFRRMTDLGDYIEAEGELFRTRTGEITVLVSNLRLIAKALRPMPEKWHGLRNVETRYRQRYLDMIANEDVRRIFLTRSHMVAAIRRFLDARGFIEVETPILQPIYGGAAARPFVTHHNALDQTLYLRIADELYLKRLIVGGLDRVYEIGHNFRNEGISTKHNPEFTAIEIYQAYADYHDIMDLVEQLYSEVAVEVLGRVSLEYQGETIDLSPPWHRITMRDAILEATGLDIVELDDYAALWQATQDQSLTVSPQPSWGKLVDALFGEYVEPKLIQPTFVMDYPREISPLAKNKPGDPDWVERFEFFIAGMESGNAFSELNDPLEQRARFAEQRRAAEAGDEEAHPMDEDFITALEHGMPPTGGLGFGIDRMAMLFTNQTSIREVILFPQLRTLG